MFRFSQRIVGQNHKHTTELCIYIADFKCRQGCPAGTTEESVRVRARLGSLGAT